MFEKLQQKWKVSGSRLAIIICTFAIGGSLTGFTGKKVMALFPIEKGLLWLIIYIILITIIWPLAVLLVSIPFGQFGFFKNYLKRMGKKLAVDSWQLTAPNTAGISSLTTVNRQPSTHIAIFASGSGTNTQKIIDHFRQHSSIKISLIVCNKHGAGVLDIAAKENIPALLIEKERFLTGDAYLKELKEKETDFIVLAGFLWKIPSVLIKAYPQRIINIHPALLPAHGGKGMYGSKVHAAVIAAGDTESGISIHYVDEIYDHGQIIFQAKCTVVADDTPETLATKIHALEHEYFPGVIEDLLTK